MWKYFFLGLLVGWLVEWLIDWVYWRRKQYASVDAVKGRAATSYLSSTTAALAASAVDGYVPYRQDELEAIEGIGPKIADLLRGNGIGNFRRLADTPLADLTRILAAAGPHFRLARPETWSEQAALAAGSNWPAFEKLKKELVAGVRAQPAAQ